MVFCLPLYLSLDHTTKAMIDTVAKWSSIDLKDVSKVQNNLNFLKNPLGD